MLVLPSINLLVVQPLKGSLAVASLCLHILANAWGVVKGWRENGSDGTKRRILMQSLFQMPPHASPLSSCQQVKELTSSPRGPCGLEMEGGCRGFSSCPATEPCPSAGMFSFPVISWSLGQPLLHCSGALTGWQ